MIENINPIIQALLGTLFTWFLTALGAAPVIIIDVVKKYMPHLYSKLLDVSLGFAAGVMIAASYWSLLAPAIGAAKESGLYGENGEFAWAPVAVGFLIGGLCVMGTDTLLTKLGINKSIMVSSSSANKFKEKVDEDTFHLYNVTTDDGLTNSNLVRRKALHLPTSPDFIHHERQHNQAHSESTMLESNAQWRRMMLLIFAITIHNIPEGMAVGVGFAAIGSSPSATFESARSLAIGIGIQNFPEGLAVAIPMRAAGYSKKFSFFIGQLSGMVEPIFGVLGAVAMVYAKPLLPYALAFAAGAMIIVVVEDIIPEVHSRGNGKLASFTTSIGFVVMMALDVGLG